MQEFLAPFCGPQANIEILSIVSYITPECMCTVCGRHRDHHLTRTVVHSFNIIRHCWGSSAQLASPNNEHIVCQQLIGALWRALRPVSMTLVDRLLSSIDTQWFQTAVYTNQIQQYYCSHLPAKCVHSASLAQLGKQSCTQTLRTTVISSHCTYQIQWQSSETDGRAVITRTSRQVRHTKPVYSTMPSACVVSTWPDQG